MGYSIVIPIKRPIVLYNSILKVLKSEDETPGMSIGKIASSLARRSVINAPIDTFDRRTSFSITCNSNTTIIINPSVILGYRVYTPLEINIIDYLIEGENLTPLTYYYLYFHMSDNYFVFSSAPPLEDMFGNQYANFDNTDIDKLLFLPNSNQTLLYMSHVFIQQDLTILKFALHKHKYWESDWTNIPGTGEQVLPHGFGRQIYNIDMKFKDVLSFTTMSNLVSYHRGSGNERLGVLSSFNSSQQNYLLPIFFGNEGIYRHSDSWRTVGFYKLILTGH